MQRVTLVNNLFINFLLGKLPHGKTFCESVVQKKLHIVTSKIYYTDAIANLSGNVA